MNSWRLWLVATVLTLPEPAVGADVSGATMERLCHQIQGRKRLLVDRDRPEVVWSDGAMFEVAKSFPPALEQLLAAPTAMRNLHSVVNRIAQDATKPGWQDAKIDRPGAGADFAVVRSVNRAVQAHLAVPYAEYILARYPEARIRVKDARSPIVVLVGETLRVAVMPLAPPRPAVAPPASGSSEQ